uniref:Uncharacterized protein n=1 Tax=Alexandrium monilatum TaxID=311494 RepID=A0A7S4QKL5_9DINO|mmetsp:Transcript_27635/g.82428  ORF Transcript_27635/g.82428 Transcript_27635/m.82428 type:complete len:175 (-) Transcript_27635:56-580(-)
MSCNNFLRALIALSIYVATACSAMFVFFGIYLMCKDLDKRVNTDSGFFCRLHWLTQGVILACASLATVIFMLYTYIMGYPIEDQTYIGSFVAGLARRFGFLQTDTGRAVYFLVAGVYTVPLLNILDAYAQVSPFMIDLGYCFGVASIVASLTLISANVLIYFLPEDGEKQHLSP